METQYRLEELVPVETLNELLDFFTALTGVAGAVMDLNGNDISKQSRYTRHCRDFIRATPEGEKACKEFAEKLGHRAIKNADVAFGGCPFLLYDCKIPIMVEGDAVGFLGLGQVLVEAPQLEKHRRIASKLGLDPEAFLDALGEVPRMGLEDFRKKARLFGSLASLISCQGAERLRAEKEAMQGLARARTLYHHLPMGINLLTPELDIIRINRFVEERLGVRAGEVEGKKCYLAAGQYRDDPSKQGKEKICDNCPAVAARKSGSSETLVRQLREDSILETTAVPVFDEQGRITEIMEIIRDVTGEVKGREEITRSRNYLSAVINNMFDGLMVLDQDLRIEDVNTRFLALYGGTREEVRGRPCYEIVGRLDRPCHSLDRPCPAREVFETGRPAMHEMTHVNSHGEEFDVEVGAAPLFNREGEVERVVAVVHDVTERKRAEETRREAEEKYRTLVEHSGEAIFIAQDGCIKFPNPAAGRLTGYAVEELDGMPFVRFIHPEDREMVVDRYRRRINGEDVPTGYTFRIIDRGHEEHQIHITSTLTTWEGRPATLNFVVDVTEQKRLETQLMQARKMEAVGALAAGVAHDFNNLLTVINGNAELAMMEVGKGDVLYEKIESINKAGEKAGGISGSFWPSAENSRSRPRCWISTKR
ncbi:MAG: PAS domain S-box protein [Deltaproteobacteria bacterium]|nr:PAS domain S-box protein [Deltaproteobacteria bacterium]